MIVCSPLHYKLAASDSPVKNNNRSVHLILATGIRNKSHTFVGVTNISVDSFWDPLLFCVPNGDFPVLGAILYSTRCDISLKILKKKKKKDIKLNEFIVSRNQSSTTSQ